MLGLGLEDPNANANPNANPNPTPTPTPTPTPNTLTCELALVPEPALERHARKGPEARRELLAGDMRRVPAPGEG